MRLLSTGLFAAACVIAAPASAQFVGPVSDPPARAGSDIRGEIFRDPEASETLTRGVDVARQTIEARSDIHDGREAGQLSRREGRSLRRESFRIDSTSARYATHGYTDAESSMLRSRTEALNSAIVAKRTQGLMEKKDEKKKKK